MSRGLSKTVNRVAAGHLSKKLRVKETKKLLKAGGHSNFLCHNSPTPVKNVDKKAMKSHADKVLNVKNSGTLAELAIAANMFKCNVVIVDKDGKRKCSLNQSSGPKGAPQITLIHYSSREHPPHGHYDVLIKGNPVKINSVGNSCMFEAFATGLKDANIAKSTDALTVRRAAHSELTRHPEKWQDHFQRKEQLIQMQHGDFLLQGGGKHKVEGPGCGARKVIRDKNKNGAKKKRRITDKKRQANELTGIQELAHTV